MQSVWLLLLAAALLPGGAAAEGAAKKKINVDEVRLETDGARSAEVRLSFPAGILRLAPGEEVLLEGAFKYSQAEWKPRLDYRVKKERGELEVEVEGEFNMGSWKWGDWEDDHNEWDLRLARELPLALKVEFGAGEGRLDLAGLNLQKLHLSMGAGEAEIDLRNTSVPDLLMEAGVGSARVDLSGEWRNDLDASFRCGVGSLVLFLPRDVGVRVEVHGLLGSIEAPGFAKNGGRYTNEAYGGGGYELDVSVAGGIGDVELRLVD